MNLRNKYNQWRLQRLRRKIDKMFRIHDGKVVYQTNVLSRGPVSPAPALWKYIYVDGAMFCTRDYALTDKRVKYIKAYKAIREGV